MLLSSFLKLLYVPPVLLHYRTSSLRGSKIIDCQCFVASVNDEIATLFSPRSILIACAVKFYVIMERLQRGRLPSERAIIRGGRKWTRPRKNGFCAEIGRVTRPIDSSLSNYRFRSPGWSRVERAANRSSSNGA